MSDLEQAQSFLQCVAAMRAAGDEDIHIVVIPAPLTRLETFVDLGPRELGVLWHPHGQDGYAAFGATHRIELTGSDRFDQLRRAAAALWDRVSVDTYSTLDFEPPRLFGGIAFGTDARDHAWHAFGDGAFTLPRWCYRRSEHGARLSFAFTRGEDPTSLAAEVERIFLALDGQRAPERPSMRRKRRTTEMFVHQMTPSEWSDQIEAIRAEIHAGRFEKIVAARRCDVVAPDAFDDLRALSRLADVRNCYRFGFRRDGATFLGASPETLFEKLGRSVTTEALAGTLRAPGSGAELLDSSKDRVEHDIVVRAIKSSLEPLAHSIAAPAEPIVRRVRNLLHLSTPLSATLSEDSDAASVLGALHPTPAVGGLPAADAVAWIADHEAVDRGWYAGAVGWIDANDDATFAVAIRCALLTSDKAHVYTGAGIVADSQPLAEYEETALKQQPMFHALGIDTDAGWVEADEDVPAATTGRVA